MPLSMLILVKLNVLLFVSDVIEQLASAAVLHDKE